MALQLCVLQSVVWMIAACGEDERQQHSSSSVVERQQHSSSRQGTVGKGGVITVPVLLRVFKGREAYVAVVMGGGC
jgi:hypothetical protein